MRYLLIAMIMALSIVLIGCGSDSSNSVVGISSDEDISDVGKWSDLKEQFKPKPEFPPVPPTPGS